MKKQLTAPAFTLLEMIIAITVFSIFIGFVVSAYLTFHRADQEALVDRSLIMESGQAMDILTSEIKANKIDYDYYNEDDGSGWDILSGLRPSTYFSLMEGEHEINDSILVLRSVDGLVRTVFEWDDDDDAKTLSVQKYDMTDPLNPIAMDGYTDPLYLTSDQVYLNEVNFRIFPDVDPYDIENSSDDDTAFQPLVTLHLTFAAQGRIREETTLSLQTTVTSRFYQ